MDKIKLLKEIFGEAMCIDINICIKNVDKVMESLTPREQKVLMERFSGQTITQIANDFRLSRQRIYQIKAKALRKMRSPVRSRRLMGKPGYSVEIEQVVIGPYPELNSKYHIPVDSLEFSTRAVNCFRKNNIINIGDIASKSEGDLLRYKNFGRKTLNEVKEILSELSLRLRR